MRLSLIFLIVFLLYDCANVPSSGGGKPRREFSAVEAFTMASNLGKGVNMGNALEASPTEESWGNPIKDEYFRLMKQAGFDTVRIPIKWSIRALQNYPYTISNEFFNRVDHVIDCALYAGLNVVINIHH
ncbi:MAG: cellulase family glycosylhydrolase, partial [Brevinematales bacterium]|nr:cellulase family glycosylhydrolase [Brevinematales bacterium]